MLDKPVVSVVVPLYNKRASIAGTIASVLAQSMGNFEVIIIDDGSTDGSAEVVRALQETRLTLIQQPNAGVSVARNVGIRAAKADWIALMDADDEWTPGHLAALLDCVANTAAVAAFSNQRLQTRAGQPAIAPGVPAQRIDNYFAFALRHNGYPAGTSAIMARKDTLLACGMFPPGVPMGEDIDTWARIACHGAYVYNACLTSTYNDVPGTNSVAGNLARKAEPPLFAMRLPQMLANGEVPEQLRHDARRYANFLQLEYARQLLDRGLHGQARRSLLQNCRPHLDPARYIKRLARTFILGRAFYRLARPAAAKL